MSNNLRALLGKKNKENAKLKDCIGQKDEEIRALKKKIERIFFCLPDAKNSLIPRAMPAELVNELFASLPMENAFDILAKMPNALLARNVRKMLKSIEMAMKNNKWNEADCGPKLAISEGGLFVKYNGPNLAFNSVRAQLPISKLNLNSNKSAIAYFEVEIVAKRPFWKDIQIGFFTQQFLLEGKWLGNLENSIGLWDKEGIYIDGSIINFGNEGGYFQAKDVIGVGIAHFPTNSTVKCFASCNGKLLGMAELPMKFAALQLFPAITMYCPNDSIRANFGADPWYYNPLQIVG